MTKSLILLTNIFKNRVYFACFIDLCVLPYMYMNKNDIKMLLFAAAVIALGYGSIFGFYYFADYIGIYEGLRY